MMPGARGSDPPGAGGGGEAGDARRGYHHGDLRRALVDAGLELAREGGPDAVVLREASRRSGVSHTAGYRHFADREALLIAVAGAAAARLADAMEARLARSRDPRARLRAVGSAYIAFAEAEPGLFRTIFSAHRAHGWPEDAGRGARGLGPYELLSEALDGLLDAGLLAPEARPRAEYLAWSAVHGLASLFIDGPLGALPRAEHRRVLDVLLDGIEAALLSPRPGP